MRLPLALLIVVAYLCAVLAVLPLASSPVVAPIRLALLRAGVLVGAYAVLGVELLSAYQKISFDWFVDYWVFGALVAGGAAGWRHHRSLRSRLRLRSQRRSRPQGCRRPRLRSRPRLDRTAWWLLGGLGVVLFGALILAVCYPPNNFDSQTYHLPRIEHWVRQGDVEPFAVRIHRQVTYPPGAEYLLLHLRVLTGGDWLYNLVQWVAAVGCALAASRITAQLEGGRLSQLLAAVLVGTTPLVVLEASSTQNDLVTALWVATVATIALDMRADPGTVTLLGLATGLVAVTKMTGLFGVAPILLFWGINVLRRTPVRAITACFAVLATGLLVIAPFLTRMHREFGNVLGPSYLSDSVTMGRHDPAATMINGLRLLHSVLDVPGDLGLASVIVVLGGWLGAHADDTAISFGPAFPQITWYPDEDRSSYPLQAALILIATIVYLVRKSPTRWYAGCLTTAVLLHISMIKWQMWGTRLTVYLLVLGAPLAGLLLASIYQAAEGKTTILSSVIPRIWLPRIVAGIATISVLLGMLVVVYGWPRRLVGSNSVLTLDEMEKRFSRRASWRADFQQAAAHVGDARRIGIAQDNDSWEYPWWVLLGDRELYALQSQVPSRPAALAADMDAVVCTMHPVSRCGFYQPPGWSAHIHNTVAVFLR